MLLMYRQLLVYYVERHNHFARNGRINDKNGSYPSNCILFAYFSSISSVKTMSDEYVEISLEDLVARSQYILLAHEGCPFRTLHRMKDTDDELTSPQIDDNPVDGGMKPNQEFITPRFHYVVEEVLYANELGIESELIGKNIHVYLADVNYRYQLHNESHDGINTMGIYETYLPQPALTTSTSSILFLRSHGGGEFEFVVDNAEESVSSKSMIIETLKKRVVEKEDIFSANGKNKNLLP